jgi:hypothetical protein
MDLVNAIVGMKQASLAAQIQYRVAAKIMDAQRMDAAAALKLLDAANIGMGKAGDELVAAATGLGGDLDVYA